MTSPFGLRAFFDEATSTVTYLVWDPATGEGAIIDPVLDFDQASGVVATHSADRVTRAALDQGVTVRWILETHAHADHLSAAQYLKAAVGGQVAIGEHIVEVQSIFKPLFAAADLKPDGGDFDRLVKDGERLPLGHLGIEVMHTPGHTPADVSYRIEDAVFVGDTLFMPDYGTARADFPGGDAAALYRSIRRLLALPAQTRMFMCHDYRAPGRENFAWETTVAEERAANVHVHDGVDEATFVAARRARDAQLAAPRLLLPSIQVNIRAGRFPPAAADGARHILVPVRTRSAGAASALGLQLR
jgi:glyoxylase-like metal-dependent hydrolase (beta-lactamase superfamily II)